jgi:hypothetical protein
VEVERPRVVPRRLDPIDVREGEKTDEKALKALVRAAVTLNKSSSQAD